MDFDAQTNRAETIDRIRKEVDTGHITIDGKSLGQGSRIDQSTGG